MQDFNLKTSDKWVHIIGIAGVTTSSIALMFRDMGWKVTGSDEDIYSPVKNILDENNIKYFLEFSFKNLCQNYKKPDLVILGSSKSAQNKEYLFAKKQRILIKSYPEILKEYVVKPESSIVVAGTFGKTTITALLSLIFTKANLNPSYMFGGFSDNFNRSLLPKTSKTEWSIIEGDEYITSRINTKSKFFYYNPDILILTAVEWDHTDVFKTEEEYIYNFQKLIQQIPETGKIFYLPSDNIRLVISAAKCKTIMLKPVDNLTQVNLIGKYNKVNAAIAMQVSLHLGIEKEIIENSIKAFSGIKRRLEIRYLDDKNIVIDDFGSSPSKARGSINSIIEEFSDAKIICVFEPNEGARTDEALPLYNDLFDDVDLVILPKFRQIKNRISSKELKKYLDNYHNNIESVEDNKIIVDRISQVIKNCNRKVVIAFLGSHEFETVILELRKKLEKVKSQKKNAK